MPKQAIPLPHGRLAITTSPRAGSAHGFQPEPRLAALDSSTYSLSLGSLNGTLSLMLPCPNCGKPLMVGSAMDMRFWLENARLELNGAS